ncbi:unnamed protein product [Brachionus calyciflorus]|uniref:RRM domain-containing protein n=1 Tax=Brachionus calyciflorus TaxID=104777 RepID=A0A813MI82_9BILA|nr:unnamed protein product [Brachionus calyciflorus]
MSIYSENSNLYSLFGPCEPKDRLVIHTANSLNQRLTNSCNLIQRPVRKSSQKSTKLFVGNLPPNTSLVELHHLFGKYGQINMTLSIVKEDNYAFIHYYDEREAEYACKELNNSLYKNRYIRVQFSTSLGHINKMRSIECVKNRFTQSATISNFQNSSEPCSASSSSIDLIQPMRSIRGVLQSNSFHDLSSEPFRSNLLLLQTVERNFLVQNYLNQLELNN